MQAAAMSIINSSKTEVKQVKEDKFLLLYIHQTTLLKCRSPKMKNIAAANKKILHTEHIFFETQLLSCFCVTDITSLLQQTLDM